jgi:hypothetical protein
MRGIKSVSKAVAVVIAATAVIVAAVGCGGTTPTPTPLPYGDGLTYTELAFSTRSTELVNDVTGERYNDYDVYLSVQVSNARAQDVDEAMLRFLDSAGQVIDEQSLGGVPAGGAATHGIGQATNRQEAASYQIYMLDQQGNEVHFRKSGDAG